MRILIATVQVPFVRGGAELLAESLRDALRAVGHEAEIVAIPFNCPPDRFLDHILACRLLDLNRGGGGEPTDLVIGLKFPAYLIPHPNKVLWILHQHRQAYDLWSHPSVGLLNYPGGTHIREAIKQTDLKFIPQAKAVFTISVNVSNRLKNYCGIDSIPLYPPLPHAEQFYCAEAENYFFYPSRLSNLKRQALILESLAETSQPVCVRFAGTADWPAYTEELKSTARRLGVDERVEWLGPISEQEKHRLYAHALGVLFTPIDEDYGYVTLESMVSAKPIITCRDSGGPLEFVINNETGFIAEPTPKSLAQAMDLLWQDHERAKEWGRAGRKYYDSLDITWSKVIERLVS
jgi:glycosyltransferase involved in cell wall biosynthesis